MTHHATNRPHTTTGRRRVPALFALAAAAGLGLAACSADPPGGPDVTSAESSTNSSSSTSSTTSTTETTVDSISEPAAASTTFAPAPAAAPAPELPANVVGTGGPCHTIGEVAQAEDGSALFCTNDPNAGPLWLPEGGPDAGAGQAQRGGPCAQEGISVAGPADSILTCTLVGGGETPGGLLWQ